MSITALRQEPDVEIVADPAATPAAESGWNAPPVEPAHLSPEDLDRWRVARSEILDVARREGWSMGEVVRRSGITNSTLSSWYSGKSRGNFPNMTAEVRRFLASWQEQRSAALTIVQEPPFVETPTIKRVLDALLYTQALPGAALITLGSGMGKTTAIRRVLATRPNTFVVTASPVCRKPAAVLRAIASAVGAPEVHPGKLLAVLGARLQRNGRQTLLMVDEAQNLGEDAVNTIRHFLDIHECGVAFLGNEALFERWARVAPQAGFGQVHSRFDDRFRRLSPTKADIEMYVAAWQISDPEVNRLLKKIGEKPGALRQISKTVKIAGLLAGDKPITADEVRRAWHRRSGEDLR